MARTTKLGALHFSIKSTGDSSRRFGPCEVCGHDASEVFRQTVSQEYEIGVAKGRLHRGDLFGHESCLLGLRSDLGAAGESSDASIDRARESLAEVRP